MRNDLLLNKVFVFVFACNSSSLCVPYLLLTEYHRTLLRNTLCSKSTEFSCKLTPKDVPKNSENYLLEN